MSRSFGRLGPCNEVRWPLRCLLCGTLVLPNSQRACVTAQSHVCSPDLTAPPLLGPPHLSPKVVPSRHRRPLDIESVGLAISNALTPHHNRLSLLVSSHSSQSGFHPDVLSGFDTCCISILLAHLTSGRFLVHQPLLVLEPVESGLNVSQST